MSKSVNIAHRPSSKTSSQSDKPVPKITESERKPDSTPSNNYSNLNPPADVFGKKSSPSPRHQENSGAGKTAGSNQGALRALGSSSIQAKLTVNTPGDSFEQEADQVAEQVLQMADPLDAHSDNSTSPSTAKTPSIQRKVSPNNGNATAAPPVVQQTLNSPGQPLDASARSYFEPRFGQDFSQVRVHSNAKSAESAQALNAAAYTVGQNIVFDAGTYQPGTSSGNRLLAHELSHTIQQRSVNPMIQRAMKFEFQTFNFIWRTKGKNNKGPEKLPRKFGPKNFLHKAARGSDAKRKSSGQEGKGMELQSEAKGFAEFETPTWSRTLGSDGGFPWIFNKSTGLLRTIQEGVEMTQAMNDAGPAPSGSGRKKYPFDVSHLRKTKGPFRNHLRPGEDLEVEVLDSAWHAGIQSSEGINLTQYESLLKEHLPHKFILVTGQAKNILDSANAKRKIPEKDLVNLHSFLQILVEHIGEAERENQGKSALAKENFLLMSRTNFKSIYRKLLSNDERSLFREIVRKDAIPIELGFKPGDLIFPSGFIGKKSPGPTIREWLKSIISKKGNRDRLSSLGGDNRALGRFNVNTRGGTKHQNLVRMEVRATGKTFSKTSGIVPIDVKSINPKAPSKLLNVRVQPANKWVDYVTELFKSAASLRPRPDVPDDPATKKKDESQSTGLNL